MRYIFANEGSSAINNLYFGQFMDWDVGDPYNTDQGGTDMARHLIYQYGPGTKYVGVGLLDPATSSNVSFILNEDYVYPNSYILDSDKIQFLNGGINVPSTSGQNDWGVCVAAGPFNLSVGDSATFAVVILGGEGVTDIQENYDSAQSRYPPVGIVEEPDIPRIPGSFGITKAYPEPFAAKVTIEYATPSPSRISLRIYDVSGRLIETIEKGKQPAGVNRAQWNGKINGKRAASGVYFCRLVVDGEEQTGTRKLLLVR
jgi:hypothetical protein